MPSQMIALKLPPGCGIRICGGVDRLFARRSFQAGEPILLFEHVRWRTDPDTFTVELANGHYFYDPLLPMIADSGEPNARLSILLMALTARRDIAEGEILTRDHRARG